MIFFEGRYKLQEGNVKHGRTSLIEKYRTQLSVGVDFSTKTATNMQPIWIHDSTMILNFSKDKFLF
jgi:hypothetical protein